MFGRQIAGSTPGTAVGREAVAADGDGAGAVGSDAGQCT